MGPILKALYTTAETESTTHNTRPIKNDVGSSILHNTAHTTNQTQCNVCNPLHNTAGRIDQWCVTPVTQLVQIEAFSEILNLV